MTWSKTTFRYAPHGPLASNSQAFHPLTPHPLPPLQTPPNTQLKGENSRLREELDKLKADQVATAGRNRAGWNKIRSVFKSDEANASISPKFLQVVRKSIPDDAARREERRREEKEKEKDATSPRAVKEIGESLAVDEED